MSEEEQDAIEQLKKLLNDFDNEDISETDLFLINRLIEKQQNKIASLEKQIKLMQNCDLEKVIEKQQKEIEREKQYSYFYKDLCDKIQKELENNKKFKKDIVNMIMLWDKKELPKDNMVIECLDTIMNEVSRLEDIEDEKIQVAVEFVNEKRDKHWKEKIRETINKYVDIEEHINYTSQELYGEDLKNMILELLGEDND